MRSYWTGRVADRFCPHCGSRTQRVQTYTGSYDSKTGKLATHNLIICTAVRCFAKAPEDLMIVGSQYKPINFDYSRFK